MVVTSKQGDQAISTVVTDCREGAESRDPDLQASDVIGRFGAFRGVHPCPPDRLSRVLRRAMYLPGV